MKKYKFHAMRCLLALKCLNILSFWSLLLLGKISNIRKK